MGLVDEAAAELASLQAANVSFLARYPGEPRGRQPVHTFYLGAQRFEADSVQRIGETALRTMDRFARDPGELTRAVGLPADLAPAIHARVRAKLQREPVEDIRIDFEDGFGLRPDDEEDAAAVSAARALGRAIAESIAPPFMGIRIKSLGETARRAARTLELFVGTLIEANNSALPEGFVVTLPKVNLPEQPRTLARWLERLESRHGLAPRSLRFEIMVETPQAFIGADGRFPLPGFLDACGGRCTGVHLGVYDFTASCGIAAAYQSAAHPMCELARGMMKLACAGRGVWLSDGSTNILPVGPHAGEELTNAQWEENREAVHRGWHLSHAHIRRSLETGFSQGWDLHPAQLPARYAACFGFYREGLMSAAARLRRYAGQGAGASAIADEPATVAALTNYLERARSCGALDAEDLEAAGLPRDFGRRADQATLRVSETA
jgi:citrate lyase beta subunit